MRLPSCMCRWRALTTVIFKLAEELCPMLTLCSAPTVILRDCLRNHCVTLYSAHFVPEYDGWFFVRVSKMFYFYISALKMRISINTNMLNLFFFPCGKLMSSRAR
jgi:hypothetical protein